MFGRKFAGIVGAVALVALAGTAQGQRGFRTEGVVDLGIEFKVYEKLSAIPPKLGQVSRDKARFEPQDDSDFIHGRYGKLSWGLVVQVFERTKAATTGEGDEAEEEDPLAGIPEEVRRQLEAQNPDGFVDYVQNKDPRASNREFQTEGKKYKAKRKTPAYELWEWVDTRGASYGGQAIELETFHIAAVYDIDGNDVVLLCDLPVDKRKKPQSKFYGYAKQMVTSLNVVEKAEAAEFDPEKDKHADTPEKKEALAAAKANIASLGNWDYISSPHYILLYSWNAEKPNERRDAWIFAKLVAERMEMIREKFTEAYPPGPEHVFPYSVIRICSDYDEFSSYGNTPRGVVGWFSPGTKELVIFFDKDRIFGAPEDAIEISYHESWHQYSDAYWPDVELHRWFDEGLAEYFSQFNKRGRKWQRKVLDGRFRDIRNQINTDSFIPISEIVYWSRAQFYGPGGPHHYAQAYSMADFILEGKSKTGAAWQDSWDGILERYGTNILETKDSQAASDAAFEGVDYQAFTEAWMNWVKKHMSK